MQTWKEEIELGAIGIADPRLRNQGGLRRRRLRDDPEAIGMADLGLSYQGQI